MLPAPDHHQTLPSTTQPCKDWLQRTDIFRATDFDSVPFMVATTILILAPFRPFQNLSPICWISLSELNGDQIKWEKVQILTVVNVELSYGVILGLLWC